MIEFTENGLSWWTHVLILSNPPVHTESRE